MKNSMWDYISQSENESSLAYDLVRYAVRVIKAENPMREEDCSQLQFLKNTLEKASEFVHEELDELPEQVRHCGLQRFIEEDEELQSEEDSL